MESLVVKELDPVVLVADIPDYHLAAGDIGTVVLVHQGGGGYEVEFIALDGETIAVVTVSADQVRPVRHREIPHARQVASA
jgi:hypothetical protein